MVESRHPVVAEAAALLAERRLVVRALRMFEAGRGGGAPVAARRGPIPLTDWQEPGAEKHDRRELEHELSSLTARLEALAAEPGAAVVLETAAAARARALRIAVAASKDRALGEAAADRASRIRDRAVRSRRDLTPGELDRIAMLRQEAADRALPRENDGWSSAIDGPELRDAVLAALSSVTLRRSREELASGLMLTKQMRGIIDEALPGLAAGDPVLLVGETGGAKTALAEHLSRRGLRREPELVSGYGDITSAQLIGTHELRSEGGATVSAFVPGPLHRAMTEGRTVILDEVNAMPPEFLKRLNRILQLRPGDRLGVQEDAGREIEIAAGFAIIATANEQTPHRYRGLDRLSAELVNRFGANAYRVHYPDSGVHYEAFPRENALLAAAAIVDERGQLPASVSPDEIARVARAAFISQQVFAGAHGEGFTDYVSTERSIDGRPGLEESVLAPRTLVAILQKVAAARGALTLDRALTRFVEGVMHAEDRRVLALILEGQGFRIG